MKTLPLLSAFFLSLVVSSSSQDSPVKEQKREDLMAALIASAWSWENHAGGTRSVETIQFYKGGFAENPKFFTARWEATGPRAFFIENTRRDGRNFGKRAYVVFDASYTHFVGFDFNGRTTVEGFRRESVDPERLAPEKSDE